MFTGGFHSPPVPTCCRERLICSLFKLSPAFFLQHECSSLTISTSFVSSLLSLLKQGKVPSFKKKQVLNPSRLGLSSAALLILPFLTRLHKHTLTLSRALNTHTPGMHYGTKKKSLPVGKEE